LANGKCGTSCADAFCTPRAKEESLQDYEREDLSMAGYKFVVSGDLEAAKGVIAETLQTQGFTMQPTGDWSVRAERGSQGASVVLGAFAGKSGRHLILDIGYASGDDGNFVIALTQSTSGMSGGLIGMSQAKKAYNEIYVLLASAFQSAGTYVVGEAVK